MSSTMTPAQRALALGYEAVESWERLPNDRSWSEVTAVATDSRDRVFAFNRGDHPIIIFDRNGEYLGAWGEDLFTRPHGLFIGPDDTVYCTDDMGHTVRSFTPDGRLLMTLGEQGKPSDTGAESVDFRTIKRAGPPFHYPTNLAISPEGDFYISDGYGNARVHKFSKDGRLLLSWGEPGTGPGRFRLPHGIAVDRDGVVFVADRENSRIQRFSPDGTFLSEWTDTVRPCQVFIDEFGVVYVAELGYRAGMWPGTSAPTPDAPGGRVSLFDSDGGLLARWGGGVDPCAPGDFFAPHAIWADKRGDIYISEVTMSAGGNRGLVPSTCPSLRKYIRRGDRLQGYRR